MSDPHDAYFRERLNKERDRAARCEDNGIARVHLQFAEAYERRLGLAGGSKPDGEAASAN